MTRDLLVIVPSRARPRRLGEMADAVLSLSRADTDIAVALDDDDPFLAASVEATLKHGVRVSSHIGKRASFTKLTNQIAVEAAGRNHPGRYRAVASLGDDHVPRTRGWDRLLLAALDKLGGTGIAYGDDLLMGEGLPTASVVSSDIVRALGWMMNPALAHFCVDNTLADIGNGAGCLAYVPGVVVEHVHWCNKKAQVDATYLEAGLFTEDHADWHAYQAWRRNQMASDIAKVAALR